MPENNEDILNTPLDPEEFKSEDNLDLDDEEVDPVGDIDLEDDIDFDNETKELDDNEFETELNDDSLDLPDNEIQDQEMIAPEEQVKWTAVPQENGDIWSEHVNGFVLRARPLSSQQGSKIKYASQLFKDNKMVDDGVIWIDKNVDAREYLENIADRILDRMNLVNFSTMDAEPEEEFGEINNLEDEVNTEEENTEEENTEENLDELENDLDDLDIE